MSMAMRMTIVTIHIYCEHPEYNCEYSYDYKPQYPDEYRVEEIQDNVTKPDNTDYQKVCK